MPAAGTKRKSGAGAGTSKKARTDANAHASAIALVNTILANPDAVTLPEDDDAIVKNYIELAQYVRALETQLAAGGDASGAKTKSSDEIATAVEKIRKAAVSGIKKQMSWKPSCTTGTAKWTYDGVCADPVVFAALMGLDAPPKWKQKKFSVDEFTNLFGEVEGSVRYDKLYITSKDVNVRYSDGEFKLSGTYGKYQPSRTDY
ncbi:hypothetical protein EIP91_005276 [Steccherinum ochraceum]|uniref:Uncharacterized protein n=1 Tax=Steccherinum ochraceum TaxID=92696 RepID=A0A4R0S1K1_9APHY|nr:hypothetical protein EIP91_005276 [Steccherinum ochraceum]